MCDRYPSMVCLPLWLCGHVSALRVTSSCPPFLALASVQTSVAHCIQLLVSMEDASSRRLRVLERQCCAGPGPSSCSSSGNEATSSSHASATSAPSSYARVHGQVSRAPARWREINIVARDQLEEVKYAKSDDGVAKVN